MDRRIFLKLGAAALVAAEAGKAKAYASEFERAADMLPSGPYSCENAEAGPGDLKLLFLGTGSAGWTKDHRRRRHSSVLLDDRILIDLTVSALDLIPAGIVPEAVFFTHSHGDHFSPETVIKLGIKKVYLSQSWLKRAQEDFQKAQAKVGGTIPEIIPLQVAERITLGDLVITSMPANHATGDLTEQALIYLVEKGTTPDRIGVRLLYATDTGGIMGIAGRIAGIDSHLTPGKPITGFIMEATVGLDMEEDFRIFNHSSLDMVAKTIHMLEKTGRYTPPSGQPAYTTHMSTKGWPKQEELELRVPKPLRPAYDGLQVVFRPID